MQLSGSVFLSALLCSTVPAAQENVWTVDDDGPADFSSLQAAIDAADDGDLLLIRAGAYSAITIDGKSLTLHGDTAGGIVQVSAPALSAGAAIRIQSTVTGQRVVLRGITTTSVLSLPPTLSTQVINCVGPVLFEECDLVLTSPLPESPGTPFGCRTRAR